MLFTIFSLFSFRCASQPTFRGTHIHSQLLHRTFHLSRFFSLASSSHTAAPAKPITVLLTHTIGSNVAVKCRSHGGCDTIRYPLSDAASPATSRTTSAT